MELWKKEEFLKLKYKLQLKILGALKYHYPNKKHDPIKILIYPCEIDIKRHNSRFYHFRDIAYPFETDEEKILTCKKIRSIIDAESDPPIKINIPALMFSNAT